MPPSQQSQNDRHCNCVGATRCWVRACWPSHREYCNGSRFDSTNAWLKVTNLDRLGMSLSHGPRLMALRGSLRLSAKITPSFERRSLCARNQFASLTYMREKLDVRPNINLFTLLVNDHPQLITSPEFVLLGSGFWRMSKNHPRSIRRSPAPGAPLRAPCIALRVFGRPLHQ